jgi:hypothetical protein
VPESSAPGVSRRSFLALGAAAAGAVVSGGCSDAPQHPASDGARRPEDLTGYLVTRWQTDAWALGSYSYLRRCSTRVTNGQNGHSAHRLGR